MTPSSTTIRARGQSYRYYVCVKSLREGSQSCAIRSVPARELERAVLYQIKTAFKAPEVISLIVDRLEKRKPELAIDFSTKRERESFVRSELGNFDALWEQLFIQEQRALLGEFLETIEVSEDGVQIHFKKNGLTAWVEETRYGTGNNRRTSAA